MLTFAFCRRKPESVELTPRRSFQITSGHADPVSPLSAPLEDMARLTGVCSKETTEIIKDLQRCTSIFLARWNNMGDASAISIGQLAACDTELQTIYSRILSLSSTENDIVPDWTHETVRIAALIYCRSIMHGATFADSGNIMHAHAHSSASRSGDTTLVSSLHDALGRTDTQSCWGHDLSGVFLWVTLIGSAASWDTPQSPSGAQDEEAQSLTWMRKCFTLYAVRAAVSVPFEHADATIHALRTMLEIRRRVKVKMGSQATS